jgi:pyruvate/2-oxoglutarate/acetoin dehydrogenase E1 component
MTATAATAATQELTFSQAINQAIRQEMRRDPTIVVIGEDVAGAAGLLDAVVTECASLPE